VAVTAALLILPLVELDEIPTAVWKLTAATGIAHGLYFYYMSRAYQEADLSLVYPIIRSTPALLPLIAVPLLGESVSPWGGLGIAILVTGIWLIHAQPGMKLRTLRSRGIRFAYLTLAATVVYSLLDKQAMVQLSEAPWTGILPRTIVFYFMLSLANTVVFAPLALRRVSWATLRQAGRRDGARAAAALAGSLLSYSLILEAFQTAPASYVVAVRQTSVLFALLFAVVWLRERPDRRRIIGAVATVAGVALISLMP
jgi:drug/metabolite transporter (DMT)-like permease